MQVIFFLLLGAIAGECNNQGEGGQEGGRGWGWGAMGGGDEGGQRGWRDRDGEMRRGRSSGKGREWSGEGKWGGLD